MNNINDFKIYNENEINNKLQNFQAGKDYFVTLSKEPTVKDYTFFNDRLKSLFGGVNWIPVQVWREKFDDENVSYRGHFEKGKDYRYSAQSWQYGQNYQGNRGTDFFGDGEFKDFMDGTKWAEHSRIKGYDEAGNKKFREARWIYRGKGKNQLPINPEPEKIEPLHLLPHHLSKHESWSLTELKVKHNSLVADLNSLITKPESDFGVNGKWKKEVEIEGVKKDIAAIEREIEKVKENDNKSSSDEYFRKGKFEDEKDVNRNNPQQKGRTGRNEKGNFVNDKANHNQPNLAKENYELKQQLAQVQAELARVLAELKQLTGKSKERLAQQQVNNEKAFTSGSAVEMREQVVNSRNLVGELNSQISATSPGGNDNKSSSLPYLIGGSVLVGSILLIGGYLVSKSRRSK